MQVTHSQLQTDSQISSSHRFDWSAQMARLEEFVSATKEATNYTSNIEKLIEIIFSASRTNDDIMETITSSISHSQLELFLSIGGIEDVSSYISGD